MLTSPPYLVSGVLGRCVTHCVWGYSHCYKKILYCQSVIQGVELGVRRALTGQARLSGLEMELFHLSVFSFSLCLQSVRYISRLEGVDRSVLRCAEDVFSLVKETVMYFCITLRASLICSSS